MHQHVAINGRQVHYRVVGQGPTVVLLHGFLESLEIWNPLIPVLKDQFRLVAIDLPGHGRSENQADVHSMELMAEVVHVLLSTLGAFPAVVVGHSMGGYVGLSLVTRYSHDFKGLVLLHSHAATDTEEAKQQRVRTIAAVKADHTAFIHAFIPGLFASQNRTRLAHEITALQNRAAGTSKKAIIAALEGMKQREDKMDFLAANPFPVLFIAGKEDERIPFEVTVGQAKMSLTCELLALNNAGHMGHLECPEEVFSAIESFCQRMLPLERISEPG